MEGFVNTDPAGSRHLRSLFRGNRMNSYSNKELVGILIKHGAMDCNRRFARRLYQERYPNRRVPHHITYACKQKETLSLVLVI
ncbi:hypothetical protein TNCV_4751551 [Trichonephila clavipes]|nr:hypothetical protein TNCV_4751551 [Trichonephila clavipes]